MIADLRASDRRTLRAPVRVRGLVLALLLASGCGPGRTTLSQESLVGTWQADVTYNGQDDVIALVFQRADDGAIQASVALPSIEAWNVPVGAATLDTGSRTVTIGKWTLAWDPRGPALNADLPEILVPVHAIRARFTRTDPIRPLVPPADDSPIVQPDWTYAAGAPIWGGVAWVDGTVYLGDDAGALHAVDARTGQRRWKVATGGAIRARPTLDERSVYVPSDDGFLYRVDAASGRVLWKVTVVEGDFHRGDRFDSYAGSATFADGTLYLGTGDGLVHALDPADGSKRWTFRPGDEVTSTPAVADGRVFVGSFDGNVYALDASSGEVLWRYDTGAPVSSSAAVAGHRVLIGSRSYDLFAFDAATGSIDWLYYYWFSWVDSDPTVVDGVAYVGSSDALRVLAVDVDSGWPRWTSRTGGWTWAQPAVSSDTVYAGAIGVGQYIGERRGGFYALDRRDGSTRWHYAVAEPAGGEMWGFASSPAIGGDRVFVGGLDGTLYAFSRALR